MKNHIKKMLVSEKELNDINFKRLKKALLDITNNLIDSDNNMYYTIDSLIYINKTISGSSNITLRKINVETYGHDKMYMNKELIEDKLYQYIDQFND